MGIAASELCRYVIRPRLIYLETIEVVDPACSVRAFRKKAHRGDLFDQN